VVIRRSAFASLLHSWLTVSSIAVALLMTRVGPDPRLIALKDVAVFGVLALYLPLMRRGSGRWSLPRFAPIAAVLIAGAIASSENPLATLASLRQLAGPYALVAVGYLAVRNHASYAALLATIRRNLWILFWFGLLERAVGITRFVDVGPFFDAKNIPLSPSGVPYVFIEPIFGGVLRMVSLLLDPINTGHSLVCLMCIEAAADAGHRSRLRRMGLAAAGVVLTTSKGAILQIGVVFGWMNDRVSRYVRVVTAVLFTFLVVTYGAIHGGIAAHVHGFARSFHDLTPFGHGLARAGNQAYLFGDTSQSEGIGDSFFGAVIGQIGIVGLAVWLYPLVSLARRLPRGDLLRRLFLSQLLVAVLSENSFNLLSVYSACLLLGASLSVVSLGGEAGLPRATRAGRPALAQPGRSPAST
jgi:hypothetical protein